MILDPETGWPIYAPEDAPSSGRCCILCDRDAGDHDVLCPDCALDEDNWFHATVVTPVDYN